MTERKTQAERAAAKRKRMKGSWIDMLFGDIIEEEETKTQKLNAEPGPAPDATECTALDFVKDPRYSMQFKLEILASCIDILNDELNDKEAKC